MTTSPAQEFSAHLLANLISVVGVEHVFLSPGSRSQSLALAAEQLASSGRLKLHVRLDERSAGFGALGVALATGRPVGIITTSGTAVANLHPAMLEAAHSGVPLIALTADRPQELREVGANQTTDQVGIFGALIPAAYDVEAPQAEEDQPERARLLAQSIHQQIVSTRRPVHVNLAFREPLSSSDPNAALIIGEEPQFDFIEEPDWLSLDGETPTVVIAGAGATADALELAESYSFPVFAEPNSGVRFGANAIVNYRRMLEGKHPLVQEIKRVIVFGKPTLSRKVNELFFDEDIEMIVIKSKTHGAFDIAHRARFADEIVLESDVDIEWLERWRQADQESNYKFSKQLDRENLIKEVWDASDLNDAIVLGASRLIRVADSVAPHKPGLVFANRGLAGIDGTIATATGVAIATADYCAANNLSLAFTRAVVGDLTAQHDVGSLAIDRMDPELNLQIIVGNDNGGSIFELLEVSAEVDQRTFDRVFRTPQQVDFWHLAEAFGWQYERVTSIEELRRALSLSGRVLIEVLLEV